MGKYSKVNSLLHTVAYSDNTTHFASIFVQVTIPLFEKHKPTFNFTQQPLLKQILSQHVTDRTHCSSNLTPPASRQKSIIFSAHGVILSQVYSGVVERQCKRSECPFLKFSIYSNSKPVSYLHSENRNDLHFAGVKSSFRKKLYLSYLQKRIPRLSSISK